MKTGLDINELLNKPISTLKKMNEKIGNTVRENATKEELAISIFSKLITKEGHFLAHGIIEILQQGKFGFIRLKENSYASSTTDIYVSDKIIKNYKLRTGDYIIGEAKLPDTDGKEPEKYSSLLDVISINFLPPELSAKRAVFEKLTPLHPTEKIKLERKDGDISMRIVDLFAPIGKGQRGLIVSPPRAGKTILLQKIANSITENHPEIILIILLIDERPEEVTDMERNVKAEVIASTFDEHPQKHVQVAKIVLEKVKRLCEYGKDVVILLDSITRLARAHNSVLPSTGRTLSGGIDAEALKEPKKFFGSARNLEEGGSLTIIGTALIETGSRMDEVIFEEFKGTGNMELVLSRELANRGIYPAIDLNKSGTRKIELLYPEKELSRIHIIRRILLDMKETEAMEFIIERISRTANNKEFLETLNKNA